MRLQHSSRVLASLSVGLALLIASAAFLGLQPLPAQAAPLVQSAPIKKILTCTPHAARQKFHCAGVVIQQAGTFSAQNPASPQATYIYGNIPTATLFTSAYNTNQAKFAGTYSNNSGGPLTNGNFQLHVGITCQGVTPGGDDASANIPSPWNYNTGGTYSYTVTGYCVDCVEGVPEPVGYPPFTLSGSVDVQGRADTYIFVNKGAAFSSIDMPNSSSYPYPCP
jgi:hypothetical protein